MNTTIVSCYYKLENSKHSLYNYKIWMANFFQIQTPKIIFTNKDTFDEYFSNIKNNNIYFYLSEFEEFKTWNYLDNFKDSYKIDHEKNIHNIFLYLLWNEKSSFIKKCINLNKFNTDYFVYCDIGCFRMGRYNKYYTNWPNIDILKNIGEDKVTILNINSFKPEDLILDKNNLPKSFQKVNRIGGGIIAGHKNILNIWYQKYYELLEKFIDNNRFIGKDQSIMATLYILNKNMINLVKAKKTPYCQDVWFYLEPYLQGLK